MLSEKTKKLDIRSGLKDWARRKAYREALSHKLGQGPRMAPIWENTQAAVQESLCETMPKRKARLDPKEHWMSGHESALIGLLENQKRCRSNLERLRDKRTSQAFHEAQLDFNRSRKQITNLQRQCQHEYLQ